MFLCEDVLGQTVRSRSEVKQWFVIMKKSLFSVCLLVVAVAMASCSQGGLKIGKSNKTFARIPALCIAETEAYQRLDEAASGTLDGD